MIGVNIVTQRGALAMPDALAERGVRAVPGVPAARWMRSLMWVLLRASIGLGVTQMTRTPART
jgi:hypothetical protein